MRREIMDCADCFRSRAKTCSAGSRHRDAGRRGAALCRGRSSAAASRGESRCSRRVFPGDDRLRLPGFSVGAPSGFHGTGEDDPAGGGLSFLGSEPALAQPSPGIAVQRHCHRAIRTGRILCDRGLAGRVERRLSGRLLRERREWVRLRLRLLRWFSPRLRGCSQKGRGDGARREIACLISDGARVSGAVWRRRDIFFMNIPTSGTRAPGERWWFPRNRVCHKRVSFQPVAIRFPTRIFRIIWYASVQLRVRLRYSEISGFPAPPSRALSKSGFCTPPM